MMTADNVLLPAPLGPMIACTSPELISRSIPFKISLSATSAVKPVIFNVLIAHHPLIQQQRFRRQQTQKKQQQALLLAMRQEYQFPN